MLEVKAGLKLLSFVQLFVNSLVEHSAIEAARLGYCCTSSNIKLIGERVYSNDGCKTSLQRRRTIYLEDVSHSVSILRLLSGVESGISFSWCSSSTNSDKPRQEQIRITIEQGVSFTTLNDSIVFYRCPLNYDRTLSSAGSFAIAAFVASARKDMMY